MQVDGQLAGVDQLNRLLDHAAVMVTYAVTPVLEAGGEVLAVRSADEARTISQRGAASITVERRDALTVAVGPTKEAFWMRFHEWGTRYLAAQGWFRRAVDQSLQEITSAMAEVFRARMGLFR